MVSARLKGGLGNQLFQIAAAHALALRNGDISGFDFDSCYTPLQGHTSNKYRDTILAKVGRVHNYTFQHQYFESKHSHQEIDYKFDIILDGYFQSEKYFEDYKEEIVDLFELNYSIKQKVVNLFSTLDGFVSVHVRRGDYLNNSHIHPTCNLEYYHSAMSLFPNATFVFASDDMGWVRSNFSGSNILYSPFDDEITDLMLMTLCSDNIIANSSFSWWGAYLNKNEEKKVVAPKNWFGQGGPQDQQDIIPETWIKL